MSDAEARRFTILIAPHLDALFRAAFRLARNRADAEDLVQETCVRAYAGIGELDEGLGVKAWLFRVLQNAFIDGARRRRRSPIVDHDPPSDLDTAAACPDPGPEESAETIQREEQLERAWRRLDRGHRALLALRAEGYALAEIAAIAGIETDALNARLYRARQSFARHLKEETEIASGVRVEVAK